MATLELRKSSRWWYGRWTENGRIVVRNLDVEVDGRRPDQNGERGDHRFEQSRSVADAKLKQIARDSKTRKHTEGLAQAVHVARTGHRVGSIPLDGIYAAWQTIPRKHAHLSPAYVLGVAAIFRRLVAFCTARDPSAKELSAITHEMAVAFLASERARGISGRSFNFCLSTLRSTFRHLRRQAGLLDNPFDEIVSQDEATVHRIPFTPAELRSILDAVKDDAFCRPLIVTGICTAMRRGDVCQLRWSDVDMDNRFITVSTSKTGAKVSIPMFGMLYDELAKLPRTGEYCFPEQATMYQTNPSGITHRLAEAFEHAGFVDSDDSEDPDEGKPAKPAKTNPVVVLSEAEMLQRGRDQILACTKYTNKVRANLLTIFERYMTGGTLGDIMRECHLSKGGASMYFKRIEEVVGFTVVRQRRPKTTGKTLAPMHVKRQGLKKVSQRGFHAFRATWVTLALTANVPVDLVRKVTGHTTVETVLVHYFQPGREDFRRTLQAAMPALLTNGAPTRDEQVRTILENSNAKTWKQDRAKALALIA